MKLGRLALGIVGAFSIGVLFFGLSGAMAPTVVATPVSASHSVAQIQYCAETVQLVPSVSSGFVGQPVAFHTEISSVTPGCGFFIPATYHYYGLPFGCVSQNIPVLTCTPSAVGVYHTTVVVTLPWVTLHASTMVSVWGAN